MADIVAETERLRLREWGEGDGDLFYAIMNNPPVMRYIGGVQTRDQWEVALQRILNFQREVGHTFWLVDRKSDGELLGFAGLKRVNSEGTDLTGQFEIGWRFRSEAWGQGYAKESAIAAMDLAFGRFDAPHVVALVVPGNASSWGLMERLGMTRRADLDFTDPRFGPEFNPWVVYRMDSADWPAARAAALGPR